MLFRIELLKVKFFINTISMLTGFLRTLQRNLFKQYLRQFLILIQYIQQDSLEDLKINNPPHLQLKTPQNSEGFQHQRRKLQSNSTNVLKPAPEKTAFQNL